MMKYTILLLAVSLSLTFAESDSDFLTYSISKRAVDDVDYTSKFLPVVLNDPAYASRISSCKKSSLSLVQRDNFECPLFSLFAKKLYRHDP